MYPCPQEAMLGYEGKRNFYRIMVNSSCELALLGDPVQRTMQGICKDISASSLAVML
jgi:hypothetical protein